MSLFRVGTRDMLSSNYREHPVCVQRIPTQPSRPVPPAILVNVFGVFVPQCGHWDVDVVDLTDPSAIYFGENLLMSRMVTNIAHSYLW